MANATRLFSVIYAGEMSLWKWYVTTVLQENKNILEMLPRTEHTDLTMLFCTHKSIPSSAVYSIQIPGDTCCSYDYINISSTFVNLQYLIRTWGKYIYYLVY